MKRLSLDIRILQNALKHGLTEQDIRHAIKNTICIKYKQNERGNLIRLSIGLLKNGQTCELISYVNIEHNIVVFHAMCPARNAFVKEVQNKRSIK